MSYLASLITNIGISIHGKQGAQLTTPTDFILEWGKEQEDIVQQSMEDQKEVLKAMANTWKANVAKGKKADPSKFKYTNKTRL